MPPRSTPAAQLSLAELNRATLGRQHLLERTSASPVDVVERLFGLQSQLPAPAYTGLWTRIEAFEFETLSALMESRAVVRIGLMRGTIHLVSARDAAGLWPFTRAVPDRGFLTMRGPALEAAGVDLAEADAATEALLREGPIAADALGERLAERWPEVKPSLVGSVARYRFPVVQTPPRGLWGRSGAATYALLDDWVGADEPVFPPETIVRRYLAGFGPASVADAQQWCGVKGLKAAFAALGDELVEFVGPDGKTRLFDLVDAPRPAADEPAPVRLLPEWDNLLLSHADRARVIDEDRRKATLSKNGILDATVLVDGRVAAAWKAQAAAKGRGAVLAVAPFERLSKATKGEIEAEGVALLSAMGDGYAGGEVVIEADDAGWAPSWKEGHLR